MKCVNATELMRMLAGQLGEHESERITAHFAHCADCARLRAEMVRLTTGLRSAPDTFRDDRAVDEVMTLIRMGKAAPRELTPRRSFWRSWQTWLLVPSTALATALLMLSLRGAPGTESEHGFAARGPAAEHPDAWVSLAVFRAAARAYEPVRESFAADDALAFSYLNRSARLHYLMVFAIDARGKVYWYYPALAEPASRSVRVESSARPSELPEQVAHDFPTGSVRIFAVFSPEPLRVEEAERAARRSLDAAGSLARMGRLQLDGTGQHSQLFVVRPATAQGPVP